MRRSPVLALAAVTALLSVTACSASGSDASDTTAVAKQATTTTALETTTTVARPEDPDQALSDAVDATLAASAFRVSSEANLDVDGGTVVLSTEGAVDYDAQVADVEVAVDGGEGQQGKLRVLADGRDLWVAPTGDVGVTMPEGKTWAEGEASRLESSDFETVDLFGVIVALRASKDAEVGDTEEIDGVETQGFTTSVTYDEAVDAAGSDADAFSNSLSLTADEPVGLDIEVWIGPDGIIRRFELKVDAPAGVPLGGTYDVELSDVGDEVEPPEAPDPASVVKGTDAEQVLDQLLSA